MAYLWLPKIGVLEVEIFFLIHIWWFFLKWSKLNVLLNLKNHKSIWSIEIFFQKAHYDIDVYRYRYRIGISRYEKNLIGNLSDRPIWKMGFIGAYRYWPIWKKAYRSYTEFKYRCTSTLSYLVSKNNQKFLLCCVNTERWNISY